MVGINMSEALDDPDLGPPVVAHVAGACLETGAARADGFYLFFDETAKLLKNEGFRAFALGRRARSASSAASSAAFRNPSALDVLGPEADGFLDNTPTRFSAQRRGRPDRAGALQSQRRTETVRARAPARPGGCETGAVDQARRGDGFGRDGGTRHRSRHVVALRFYRAGKEAKGLERLKQR